MPRSLLYMPRSLLYIFQQVHPVSNQPFCIIEHYFTFDGTRSRICDGRWKTEAEALLAIETKLRKQKD